MQIRFLLLLIIVFLLSGCFKTSSEKAKENDTISYQGLDYKVIKSSKTGRLWLDRNLGAIKRCKSLTDKECYGALYGWGLPADGRNELRGKNIKYTKATDFKWYGNLSSYLKKQMFFTDIQGGKICPKSFRVPTKEELRAEFEILKSDKINQTLVNEKLDSEFIINYKHRKGNMFSSKYKRGYEKNHIFLPLAGGYTFNKDYSEGKDGYYWTSKYHNVAVRFSKHISPTKHMSHIYREGQKFSIRCIKETADKLFFDTDDIQYKMKYYESGMLEAVLPVKKGTKIIHGKVIEYNKNGIKIKEIEFIDNLKNGKYTKYNKDNEIVYQSIFKDDKEVKVIKQVKVFSGITA